MANIRSFPNNQDEYIGAEDVMRWHHGRTSGVFGAENNAAVAPVIDTMAVTVSDGIGWLADAKGRGIAWWIDEEAKTGAKLQIQVSMADAVLPRIDRIVVSWQTTNYVALPEVVVLKGTPASAPVAPTLTNDTLVRQISLAAIRIPAGATAIDASMISDERLDSSVCGIVTEAVKVDTSVMQAQFSSFFSKTVEEQEAYLTQQKAAWEAFFSAVANDTLVPVPTSRDVDKAVVVNENGNGYALKKIQGGNIKTYTSLEQIDLSSNATLDDIIMALDDAVLQYYCSNLQSLFYNCPMESGFLKIETFSNWQAKILITDSDGSSEVYAYECWAYDIGGGYATTEWVSCTSGGGSNAPTLLTSDDDLDDISESGIYYWSTDDAPSNLPCGYNLDESQVMENNMTTMRVWNTGNGVYQEILAEELGYFARRFVGFEWEWVIPPYVYDVLYKSTDGYYVSMDRNGFIHKWFWDDGECVFWEHSPMTYGTSDLTAGSSYLSTGAVHLVYE